jgi:hypothetical protein
MKKAIAEFIGTFAFVFIGCGSGEALKQIWLYIVAPLIGARAAGYLFRSGVLAAETVIPIRGEVVSDVPPGASAPRDARPRRREKLLPPDRAQRKGRISNA